MSPYSKSESSSSSPAFRYMLEPSTPYASRGTVTISSTLHRSSAISAVMIFVVLAMGSRASDACANSSRPVSASMSAAPRAPTAGGATAARACAGSSSASSSAASGRRPLI